jgi:MFS family permease
MSFMTKSVLNDKVVMAYFPLTYFILGFVGALTMDATLYYLYVSGGTPLEGGLLIALAYLPWAIKPINAYIQDWYWKYHNWVFVSIGLVAIAVGALSLMFDWGGLSLSTLVIMVALCSLGRVSTDVAIDGWAVHLTRDDGGGKLRTWMEAAGFLGGIFGFPLVILILGDDPVTNWPLVLGLAALFVVMIGLAPLVVFKDRFRVYEEEKGRTQIDWPYLWQWIKAAKWLFVFGFVSSLTFAIGKVLGLPWLLSLGYGPTQIAYFLIGNFVFAAVGAYSAGKAEDEAGAPGFAVLLLAVAYLILGLSGYVNAWTSRWVLVPIIALTGFADGFFIGAIGMFFTRASQRAGPNGPATKFAILIASTNLSAAIFAILTGLVFTAYSDYISYKVIWMVAGMVPAFLTLPVAIKLGGTKSVY